MPQHTIGISDNAAKAFQQAIYRFREKGFHASATRAIQYLCEFEMAVIKMFEDHYLIQDGRKALEFLQKSYAMAAVNYPPVIPRGNYKRSRYATVEQRARVVQELTDRLGIHDAPDWMVDQFLDGDTDKMIREQVVKNMVATDTKQPKKNTDDDLRSGVGGVQVDPLRKENEQP